MGSLHFTDVLGLLSGMAELSAAAKVGVFICNAGLNLKDLWLCSGLFLTASGRPVFKRRP